MNDADVTAYFAEYVRGFMFNDLENVIQAKANFGAALMLFSYTEVLGGLANGQLGQERVSKACFEEGLRRMRWRGDSNYYAGFTIKLQQAGEPDVIAGPYKVFRCGLAHTYFAGESGAWVHNGKGTCGPTLASAGYPPQIVDEILAAEKSSSSFYSEPFGAGGPHQIYFALDKGSKQVKYIGRTDGLGRRAAEHWASKGREIQQMSGLSGLSLSDARAVEQVLIEFHGLKNLDNAINSISPRRNIYPYAIERGKAILYRAGYTLE